MDLYITCLLKLFYLIYYLGLKIVLNMRSIISCARHAFASNNVDMFYQLSTQISYLFVI
jgi:hypothetical protein